MIGSCLAYLLGKIGAIEGIGNTLDYFPSDAVTGTIAQAAFVADGAINCAIVRRKLAEEESGGHNYAAWQHTIWIETLRAYEGSDSQHAHDTALDAILQSFRGDARLNNTVVHRGPARLVETEPRFFYQWLVHYGRIEVRVST